MLAKLFKQILAFGKRYVNETYSIPLYLNMGRLLAAEIELNELLKSSKELLSTINFVRLKNVCKVVHVVKIMRKKFRINQARKEKARRLKEREKELLAYNKV